jgi:hypothetical protein
MMSVHRVEARIDQDGTLTLDDLPFRAGEEVEVLIRELSSKPVDDGDPYPLRGLPVRYEAPTAPVAENEWGARRC